MIPRFRLDSPTHPEQVEFLRAEFERRGWIETQNDDWSFCWSFDLHDDATFGSLRRDQKVNHFAGIAAVHFKDEFAFHTAAAGFGDVIPETYHVGRELDAWRTDARRHPEKLWILKPTNLTGGRGTRILTDPGDFDPTGLETGWIVQRYIADPLLLPGQPFKHTIRVYALVTSLDPLVAFVHSNGPVKFTSREFGTEPHELADPVRHLTNPSIQLTNTEHDDPVRATDWIEYASMLETAGADPELVRDRIDRAVMRALLAARDPVLVASRHRCNRVESCYELLGYDVTLDADLRPWLLECNASPSLGLRGTTGSSSQDAQRRSKQPMIAETLTLLGVNEIGEPAAADYRPGLARATGGWEAVDFA